MNFPEEMDQQPPEVFRQILDLVDFETIVRTSLTCKRWADYVIEAYPYRLEKLMEKVEHVDDIEVNITGNFYMVKKNGEQVSKRKYKNKDVKLYATDQITIKNEDFNVTKNIERKLLVRCSRMTQFWWKMHISTITMVDVPLTVFHRVVRSFSNKKIATLKNSTGIPLFSRSVQEMNQLIADFGEGYELHIDPDHWNNSFDRRVIFDDSTLELMISNLSNITKPMGSFTIDAAASISLPVLLRFLKAVSVSPVPDPLIMRSVTLLKLQIKGNRSALEEIVNSAIDPVIKFSHSLWNGRTDAGQPFDVSFRLRRTYFHLIGCIN